MGLFKNSYNPRDNVDHTKTTRIIARNVVAEGRNAPGPSTIFNDEGVDRASWNTPTTRTLGSRSNAPNAVYMAYDEDPHEGVSFFRRPAYHAHLDSIEFI